MNAHPLRFLLALWLLLSALPALAERDRLAGLDAVVREVMTAGDVPGLAVVVVEGDRVVLAKGYGTRQRGLVEPVDGDTLFGLASLTKAFTATAASVLVDRGALRFDERIVDVLPEFRVADPYVSREMTVRDVLAHRTGLAATDLLWYLHHDDTAETLTRRFVALPQQTSLRERFGYNNLMYVLAGEVIARRSGSRWEDFVATSLLGPLGMTRTTVRFSDLAARDNVATPHIRANGQVMSVPHHRYQNTAPSGAIYSSANDVARWMRMLLAGGTFAGQRIVGAAPLAETMTPQMWIGATGPADGLLFPESNFITYGMGWFISDYRGHRVLSHTGGIDGMAAFIALLPDRRLGVAVLENLESDMARVAVRNWIFDRTLGASGKEWPGRYADWTRERQERLGQSIAATQAARRPDTRPSLPPAGYQGRFANALLGQLVVSVAANGELQCRIGDLPVITLEHWHYDSYRLSWPDATLNTAGPTLLTFELDAAGRPARVVIRGPMLDADAVYEAVGD